jgi:hypothetical protein
MSSVISAVVFLVSYYSADVSISVPIALNFSVKIMAMLISFSVIVDV